MNNASIIGTQPFTSPSASQAGITGSQVKSGQWRGETVVVLAQDDSKLGSAAEEVTMLLSEKIEQRKDEEREVTAPTHVQVMKIEEINEYLETAKALEDPQELVKLAQRMMAADSPSPLLLARQAFRDNESNQYVALEFALQYARSQGAPLERQERILDAIQLLCGDPEVKRRIHAGLNATDEAAYAPEGIERTAADISRFQKDYADIAAGGRSLQQTFVLIEDQVDGKINEFLDAVDRYMKALGADLAALRVPTSSVHLEVVNKGLTTLKQCNTLYEAADGVVVRSGLSTLH